MTKLSDRKDFDPIARQMNLWLESELGGNKDIAHTDTKHVIAEESFIKAINKARKELGLDDFYSDTEDEEKISNWLMSKLAGKKIGLKTISEEEWLNYLHRIDDVIFQVIKEANLQSGWYAYVEAFVALGKAPKTIDPIHRLKIYVEGVSEDKNSLVIRLDKGLSSEDYKKAWSSLKRFLLKPSTAPVYADVLKNKVYLDHKNGMTYGELAKKYFPHEYGNDKDSKTDYARDKVKKIVARYKKPI